jgi:L-ribulose-5-phosphate 3-epimerase
MKKSINIGAVPGKIGFEDGLKIIKDAGFEGVELNVSVEGGVLNMSSKESEVKAVREKVTSAGLEVASLLPPEFWQYPLTGNDPERREKGEELLKRSLQICNWMGTDALLLVPGVVKADWVNGDVVSYDTAYKRSQESIGKALDTAERTGVSICIENVWNKFLLSPLEMKRFVEELKSDYVGVYFDVGNILVMGFPEMWIRILGKKIKRIHLKDFKLSTGNATGFCDLLEGDVNWPEVMKALKETGYNSYLTAEIGPYKYSSDAVIYNTSLSIDRILSR